MGTPAVNQYNSVVHPSNLYGYVIDVDPDFGEDGYFTIMAMSRTATNIPWTQWDGVAVFKWPPSADMASWVQEKMDLANVRFKAISGDPSPTPAFVLPAGTAIPGTFPEFKSWLVGNTHFNGAWIVPGPAPTVDPAPSIGYSANLAFDIGKQRLVWNLVWDEQGNAVMRCQRWVGPGPNDWQFVKLA